MRVCAAMALVFAAAPAGAAVLTAPLQAALRYWQAGEYASAVQAFETILWLEDLPPDVHGQADSYAAVATEYLAGRTVLPSGYGIAGVGHYRENNSIAGRGEARDLFAGLRAGGRVNLVSSSALTINASVDYRYRRYDHADRRDDSDLRWSLGGSRPIGRTGWAFGARGWLSARGDGVTRSDAGVFTTFRFREGKGDQFEIGAELRRRAYPYGPLRYRTRDIVEATASWTHALAGGRASVGLAAHGGRVFPDSAMPDGASGFIGLSPSVNVTVSERIGAYVFGWWQNDRYAVERFLSDSSDAVTGQAMRNDNLYEVGGGMTWNFAPGWELNPGILYVRDRSNIVGVNYSATEFTLNLRRDF